jgi:hypothetical protein
MLGVVPGYPNAFEVLATADVSNFAFLNRNARIGDPTGP